MHNLQNMHVLIHAPTDGAMQRARNNAKNLNRVASDVAVCIVANAEAVVAALDLPEPETGALTFLCAATLQRIGRTAPHPLKTVPVGFHAIALMQLEGWLYVRA